RNQLSILQNFRDLIPRAGEAGRVLGQDLGTRLVDGITGGATQTDIVRAIQGSLKPEEFEKRFASEASAFSGIKELTNNVGKSIEASVQYVDPNTGLIGFIRNFDQKFFEI